MVHEWLKDDGTRAVVVILWLLSPLSNLVVLVIAQRARLGCDGLRARAKVALAVARVGALSSLVAAFVGLAHQGPDLSMVLNELFIVAADGLAILAVIALVGYFCVRRQTAG